MVHNFVFVQTNKKLVLSTLLEKNEIFRHERALFSANVLVLESGVCVCVCVCCLSVCLSALFLSVSLSFFLGFLA